MASAKQMPQEDLDVERIVIYPRDLDKETRQKLWMALRELGVKFEAGYWG